MLLVICVENCGPCERLYSVLEEVGVGLRGEEEDEDENGREDGNGKAEVKDGNGNGNVNGTEEGEEKKGGKLGKRKTAIATILCDKNDIPLRRIRAFPTILLFPASHKGEPVRFLGDRTVENLRDFIKSNRSA